MKFKKKQEKWKHLVSKVDEDIFGLNYSDAVQGKYQNKFH